MEEALCSTGEECHLEGNFSNCVPCGFSRNHMGPGKVDQWVYFYFQKKSLNRFSNFWGRNHLKFYNPNKNLLVW